MPSRDIHLYNVILTIVNVNGYVSKQNLEEGEYIFVPSLDGLRLGSSDELELAGLDPVQTERRLLPFGPDDGPMSLGVNVEDILYVLNDIRFRFRGHQTEIDTPTSGEREFDLLGLEEGPVGAESAAVLAHRPVSRVVPFELHVLPVRRGDADWRRADSN